MNSKIQKKIDEIKRQSAQSKAFSAAVTSNVTISTNDALSISIRSKKDADTFMSEVKAISKSKS
ncbi:hypothetical protein SAMN05421788_101767 [Filimonas lacunae]|uniref:Uncharacterized protein n=1 Tax=Filimonas lacunae TaxID=477680 RepID=A0A1N7LBN3_9BACT|nr:hypothetical protein [Filimonas lacunae]SIS71207.1 hypothetical protein SAMN05421788_101767 [Filimonas lacunae]